MGDWEASWAAARAEIRHFHDDMREYLAEIRQAAADDYSAYVAVQPGEPFLGDSGRNTYYEPGEWGSSDYGSRRGAGPGAFEFSAYRSDIESILFYLERYVDQCRIGPFDTIAEKFEEIVDELKNAEGHDGGMNNVASALEEWNSGAAENFRQVVLVPFSKIMHGQAKLAVELARAARGYQGTIIFARADVLNLTKQLRDKVVDGGGDSDFTTMLRIIGAVAAGAALISSGPGGWATLAWAANTSALALTAVADAADREPGSVEEWTLKGRWATDFIIDAYEKVQQLSSEILIRQGVIEEGLAADEQEIAGTGGVGEFVAGQPGLMNARSAADLGTHGALEVADIRQMKVAGAIDLPAIAEMLDDAHLKLASIRDDFDTGIGPGIAGNVPLRAQWDVAVARLDAALTGTRDFLYWSGQSLATIADNYYLVEESNAAKLQQFQRAYDAALADNLYDLYDPDWSAPRTPGPT